MQVLCFIHDDVVGEVCSFLLGADAQRLGGERHTSGKLMVSSIWLCRRNASTSFHTAMRWGRLSRTPRPGRATFAYCSRVVIRFASTTATYSFSRNAGVASFVSSPESTVCPTSRHTASERALRTEFDAASSEDTPQAGATRTGAVEDALPRASMPPTYTPGSPGFSAIRNSGSSGESARTLGPGWH